MSIARRFVVLFALMFWQGGFMFYGGVTVPIMRVQLEGRPERGLVTQHVTQWMNLIGTLALLAMFADTWASKLPKKRKRWIAWLVAALPHPIVIFLHAELSRQMAVPGFHQSDMGGFFIWHKVYLLNNTLQWLGGMAFVALSLKAWREEDRAPALP